MAKQSLIRKHKDILAGLLAWAVAIGNLLVCRWDITETLAMVLFYSIPVLWTFLTSNALEHRQRRAIYLSWIWPSAPLAFYNWYLGVLENFFPTKFIR